jgi:hypothetical protein
MNPPSRHHPGDRDRTVIRADVFHLDALYGQQHAFQRRVVAMTLNLPKSPNPNAADDVTKGRELASEAARWLAELDAVLAQTDRRDPAKAGAGNTSTSR